MVPVSIAKVRHKVAHGVINDHSLKVKDKGTKTGIAPHRENLTPEELRYGSHSCKYTIIPAFAS